MKNIFYSSKDEIRNRILKNVRDFWGIKNMNELDPLVNLIMEALSTELFNISTEVKGLETRMLDKLASILNSDTLSSASPAHAILHAHPAEATELIKPEDQFFVKRKTASNDDDDYIFFSPLSATKLFDAEVVYLAHGNSLFENDRDENKILNSHTIDNKRLNNNMFYVGLECPASAGSLEGLSFYFNFRNYLVDEQIYELIALSKWQVNDLPITMARDKFLLENENKYQHPFEMQTLDRLLHEDIQAFYSNRFLTIDQPIDLSLKTAYPTEFEKTFPAEVCRGMKKDLMWFTLKLPSGITPELMEELHISVNAFPVMNRKKEKSSYQLSATQNIIPVKTTHNEYFLSVHTLTDTSGNSYTQIPRYSEESAVAEGTFSMRYGSGERFDQRNVKEVIDFLFELLRDEKAAFAAYGIDFIYRELKDLEQNIAVIEERASSDHPTINELQNYIIVKPINNADFMHLEFWTTRAELGNQISAGSKVKVSGNSKIWEHSLFLLSTSLGGKPRLSTKNRIRAYKYGSTSGNRIVTKSDIINFCLYELGDNVSAVHVTKGLRAAMNTKEGFIRTTDIQLSPAKKNKLNQEQWSSLLELTRIKLINRSAMNMQYRLMLI